MLNLLGQTFKHLCKYYLFVVLMFSCFSLSAQINNADYRINLNSQDMGPCGSSNNSNSAVNVLAKSNTLNDFEITFDLPDGVFYIPGTEAITTQQGSSDYTLSVVDATNLNAPRFRLERPGNANWEVADRVRFRFRRTASCEAVNFSYNGGLFKDAHTINYQNDIGAQTDSDTDPTINSYQLLRAFLAVLNYNDVNAENGDALSRTLDITNSGNGDISSVEHNVVVGSGLTNYQLFFNGSLLTPVNVSGTNRRYTFDLSQAPFAGNVGDGDAIFENETISLTETFTVADCDNTNVSHQPTWGCDPTDICQLPDPVVGRVLVNNAAISLDLAEVGATNFTAVDEINTGQIRITNNSAVDGFDININTGFKTTNVITTNEVDNALWGNDNPFGKELSNFRIGTTSVTPVIRPNSPVNATPSAGSFFIPQDFFTTDPDGVGTGLEDLDGDGFFDDLAPGAFTDLFYDFTVDALTLACGETTEDIIPIARITTDVYLYNRCGNRIPTPRRFDGDRVRLQRRNVTTNAPSDISNGTEFNVSVIPQMVGAVDLTDRPTCGGLDFFTNDPSTTMTVILNVPQGILLNGAPAGYTQISPTEIQYVNDQLSNGDPRFLQTRADFPLVLDCNVYAGPQIIDLNYSTTYSNPCITREIHCGVIENIRTQCPVVCDGVIIDTFDAQRTSLGWTDAGMSTPIVPDSNIHGLDTYINKDEMRLQTSATLNNTTTDNLFFDLFYTTESVDAGLANIITFLNGEITINDISSGPQTVALDLNDITVTSTGNDHRLRIDLSSYSTIISPTYQYGEPQTPSGAPEADQVSLDLNFQVDNIPVDRTLFEMENFSGTFVYNDISGNPVTCNERGDRFSYFRPRVVFSVSNNAQSAFCNPGFFEFSPRVLATPGDRFPNEFRRAMSWEEITIELPPNTDFVNAETLGFPNGNTNLNVNQTGNTITVSPNGNFRYLDLAGDLFPRIRIRVLGTAQTPASTTAAYTFDATRFPDSNSPEVENNSGTINFSHSSPNYNISSLEPVVIADNIGATFEVDVCMFASSNVDFNWLRVANGSFFTITRAYEVTGAGDVPLNFTNGIAETYIEIGRLEDDRPDCNKIRFEIQYTECDPFDFVVDQSYSCSGYPTDFTTVNYSNPYTLRLEPQQAILQFAMLDEPTGSVDMCTDFNIDLEVRNAGNGNLINPTVVFDAPGDAASLNIEDILVEYPRGTPAESVSFSQVGSTITVNMLDDTDANTNNGLMGSLSSSSLDEQIAIVRLRMSVACSFVSSDAITFEAFGNDPCGSPSTGNGSRLSTNPIIVTDAEPFYDAVSTITIPNGGNFNGCSTQTVSVESIIVGGPTGTTDFARIILPDGLAFDVASFSSSGPFVASFNSIATVDNHEEIILNMPAGVNNGEIIRYAFDVSVRNTLTSCTPASRIELFNFTTVNTLTCNGVSCGVYEVPTGDTFRDVVIAKAELVESTFVSNADYTLDGSGNHEYHIEFGVANVGSVDVASGFVYNIYCADASGVRSGTSIYTGTINQVITAGNSITEDIIFTTATFCGDVSNMIVEFVPSDTNCHCDVLSIPLASEPEVADLELTSSVDIASANPGDTVTFTVQVLNNGPFDAQNIGIENLLPAGYTIASIANSGSQSGNIIAWPQFDLASGDTSTFTFTATLNSPTGIAGEYDNITEVVTVDEYDVDSTPDNYDGLPLEDDEAIVAVTILTANLSLNKALSAASGPDYNVGDTVTFEITLNNIGPDETNNVSVEDIVPSGFTIGTINNGGVLVGNTITWDMANVPVGSQVLSYEVTINAPTNTVGEYTNIAQVTASDQFDPNSTPNNDDGDQSEDDEANFTVSSPTADLEIINSITPSTVNPGDAITISLEIINNGPYDATNIGVENMVPFGFTVTRINDGGTQSGNAINWNLLNIPNSTIVIVTYEATINQPSNVTDEYLNVVQVTSVDQNDNDSTPNNDDGDQSEDDEDNATISLSSADLSLSKELSASAPAQPNSGDTVLFEITLTNSGNNAATNVSIEDIVPSGYSIGTINNGGVAVDNIITWNIANVPIGSQILSYEVTLNAPTNTTGEYTNVVQVTASDQFDPNSTPNNDDGDQSEDDEASFTINAPTVDLEIVKTVDNLQAEVRDTLLFAITVTNNSIYTATNIGIEDILPEGFSLISHSTDNGSYDPAVGLWEISSLNTQSSATLEMRVTVTQRDGYTNIAQLIYLDQIDDNIDNDMSEVTIQVTENDCLVVYNEFSPNNDGANEFFFIECIEDYPNNTVQVFNRWGIKVFEQQAYNNTWDGTSMGRATTNANEKLPVGTYYYILEPGDGQTPPKSGWLYITR